MRSTYDVPRPTGEVVGSGSDSARVWDRQARLAAHACACSFASIILVDAEGAACLAGRSGPLPLPESSLLAFAEEALQTETGLVLRLGISEDFQRFFPESSIAFAAGYPIPCESGGVGALCLFDGQPREGVPADVVADLVGLVGEQRSITWATEQPVPANTTAFYQTVLDELPLAVEVLDVAGRYVWANRAATAGRPGEMVGKTPLEYALERGEEEILYRQRNAWVRQIIALGEGGSVEEVLRRPDGSERFLLHTAVPVLDASRTVRAVIAYRVDQTEIKRYERELMASKEASEALDRLKTSLLSNINHEVRTPLTSIIGFADILRHSEDPESREFATLIRKNGRRLMLTLNAVLDMAQLQSGSLALRPSRFDLNAFLRDEVEQFRPEVEEAGGRLVLIEAGGEIPCDLDYMALHRVMGHLLSNAAKFTDGGDITVRVKPEGERVWVEVEDTGIGIDPAFQARLFEPFTQESVGMDRRYDGLGLGLALSKAFLEMMGGTITVESAKDRGSIFRVGLPYGMEPKRSPGSHLRGQHTAGIHSAEPR